MLQHVGIRVGAHVPSVHPYIYFYKTPIWSHSVAFGQMFCGFAGQKQHTKSRLEKTHILQQGATVAASTQIYFSRQLEEMPLALFGLGILVSMHVGSNRHMLVRFLYHGATHDGDGSGDVLPSK